MYSLPIMTSVDKITALALCRSGRDATFTFVVDLEPGLNHKQTYYYELRSNGFTEADIESVKVYDQSGTEIHKGQLSNDQFELSANSEVSELKVVLTVKPDRRLTDRLR